MNSENIKKALRMPLKSKLFLCKKMAYSVFHRHKFGSIATGAYISKPIMLVNPKQMHIGRYVSICDGARIECISEWNGQNYQSKLIIGDAVQIGQNVHIECADELVIGNEVTISSNVFISDNEHDFGQIGKSCYSQPITVNKVSIGEYSFIGVGAVIMAGVSIGKNVVVGANAVVTKSIPDNSMVAGVPAKIIKRFDSKEQKWVSV